jgi:hypothetical protein
MSWVLASVAGLDKAGKELEYVNKLAEERTKF